jgi:SAM-dependent methyltransferase
MQKNKWIKEYLKKKDLPSSRTTKPSKALLEFISTHPLTHENVLDVGSGLGRNSIYLVKLGNKVTGIDIVELAIKKSQKNATTENLLGLVNFKLVNAGEKTLPFNNEEFSLVLDMMTLHVLDKEERNNYAKNINRILKPGGYFVFYTLAADSPAALELFKSSPGPEPNSYIIPQSGMIEKAFTKIELMELFAPLQLEKLDRKVEFTPAFGDIYERVYYSGIFNK